MINTMGNTYMVEDCSTITPRDVLRGLEWSKGVGTRANDRKLDMSCWLDNPSDPDDMCISINGQEPQKLILEWVSLTFGQTAYFNCGCGYRATKLYLPPGGTQFGCRRCLKLRYRSSTINPRSVVGNAIHRFDRRNKLADIRANMSRIFYRGEYTKRYTRFLSKCDDAGLTDVVNDAESLLKVIKTQ